jgi:hypothetical protein
MTVTVNFKINAITKQLEVSLLKDEASEQETCVAKRILSMATQLNFVNLPISHGIDVGASIEVMAEDSEDSYYRYGEDDDEDELEIDDQDDPYAERNGNIEDVIDLVKEEEVRHMEKLQNEVDCDKTKAQIEEMVNNGEPLRWAEGEDYIDVRLNLDEANKIIGGLTTPSSIATMMIYELFKKTIHKVEKYV